MESASTAGRAEQNEAAKRRGLRARVLLRLHTRIVIRLSQSQATQGEDALRKRDVDVLVTVA